MVNIKENEQLNILNHSCAHLLAHAVKRLYPGAKFFVGPVIENGFYYDIDLGDLSVSEDDLVLITKEMKKIAKDNKRIVKMTLSKEEALRLFADDPYKIDLINGFLDNEPITAYKQDDFVDLCRGPHVSSTKEIKFFKLLKVSGAYYKNDPKNKMLQRIYGIAFLSEEELNRYLALIEEAKARDHKKLGKELGLFMTSEFGPGFPFWLPNGVTLKNTLLDYWQKVHIKRGYVFTETPILLEKSLWEMSGHWNNYKENMYKTKIDERDFLLKPMNCPGGLLVYKNSFYSYKDLPLRLAELGRVHRHEASGALNGLFRVRSFTQDDAHIFLRKDQLENEILELISFIDQFYTVFGLTYHIELSTRPVNYVGDIEIWELSEAILERACKKANKEYKVNVGDGAFYGPKLDFHIKDSLGRMWQCGTIQLDMNLPVRFDITYIESDGSKAVPIVLHRVILGSVERFIGILIEHYGGNFPFWLAVKQVLLIPINNEHHLQYVSALKERLESNNIRVEIDSRDEKLGYKIRQAQKAKIPYQVIVGDNEVSMNTINVREYGSQEMVSKNIDDFILSLVRLNKVV